MAAPYTSVDEWYSNSSIQQILDIHIVYFNVVIMMLLQMIIYTVRPYN